MTSTNPHPLSKLIRYLSDPVGPVPLACTILVVLTLTWSAFSAPPVNFRAGVEFAKVINRPLLLSRDFTPLRALLQSISKDRNVAILLDRRIDPQFLISSNIQSEFLDTGLNELLKPVPAEVVTTGDTLFVTTPDNAAEIRTRIALAEQELRKNKKIPATRQAELLSRTSLRWNDLDSPREILSGTAARDRVTIENPEAIPHDLVAAGSVTSGSLATRLLILLSQYDLEFEWVNGEKLRIVPQTLGPRIEQEHAYRGKKKQEVLDLIQKQIPDAKFSALSDRVKVTTTLDHHDQLAIELGNRPARKVTGSLIDTALSKRQFTIKIVNRPFSELIDKLSEQGIEFDRHEALTKEANIDLNQAISLELSKASIDDLLTTACEQLGLAYQIDGMHIDLYPAQNRKIEEPSP
ncbi:hypothetical protein SH668x_000557 [Planctomicrobium sp. SH668]|uniref:hypothetical protein n=1 Tax=Planctomicrobium sp. SH668 TaxID=3448126 RepID=UPI003F5C6FD0